MTTDGHDSYPRALRKTLGSEVTHRCNPYLNNRLEQDHRGIKQRYYPMRGLSRHPGFSARSDDIFCRRSFLSRSVSTSRFVLLSLEWNALEPRDVLWESDLWLGNFRMPFLLPLYGDISGIAMLHQ